MKISKQNVTASILAVLLIFVAITTNTQASIGTITKADLSGNWRISMFGVTGCGKVAMMTDVTLNAGYC